MQTLSLKKWVGLLFAGIAWAAPSLSTRAEPIQIPPPSPSTPSLPSPRPPATLPHLQRPLKHQLFSSLLDPSIRFGSTETRPDIDQSLESAWQEIVSLEEDAPQFTTQVQAFLPTLLSLQQQYQAFGDSWGELKTLEIQLKLYYLSCQDEQAVQLAQDGLAIAQTTGSSRADQQWTDILTALYWVTGEQAAAIALQEQILEARRSPEGNFTFLAAYDWMQLGDLYMSVGREADAIAAYQQAVTSAHRPPTTRILDVYYAAGSNVKQSAIAKLIAVYQTAGDTAQQVYWTQQLQQATENDDQFNRASELLYARTSTPTSQPTDAIPLPQRQARLEEALQIFRQIGDVWGEIDTLVQLSQVAADQANYSAAIAFGEAAFALAMASNAPRSQEVIVPVLIQAYRETGQDERAEAVQRDYLQESAQSESEPSIQPIFYYGFAISYPYETLALAHQQRACFDN